MHGSGPARVLPRHTRSANRRSAGSWRSAAPRPHCAVGRANLPRPSRPGRSRTKPPTPRRRTGASWTCWGPRTDRLPAGRCAMSHARRAAAALAACLGALVVGVRRTRRGERRSRNACHLSRGVLRDAGPRALLRHLYGTLTHRPRGVAGDLPLHRCQHLLRWPQPRLCSAQPDGRVGAQCLGGWLVADPDLLRRPAVLRLREQALPVRGQRRGGARECGRDRRRGPSAEPGAPSRQRPLRRRRALRPDQRLLCHRSADVRLGVDPGPAPQRVPRRCLRPPGLRSSRIWRGATSPPRWRDRTPSGWHGGTTSPR